MRTALCILFGWMIVSFCCAADWPQWRGPALNGTSDQTDLPDSLDPNTMLWKTALPGPGPATPAIVNGQVYLSGYIEDSRSVFAMGLDAATGRILWTKSVSTVRKTSDRHAVSGSSPVADESGAVFLFSDGLMTKFAPDGTECWRRDLDSDYGPLSVKFGYSSSPLLDGERLYIVMLRRQQPYPHNRKDFSGLMDSYLLCVDYRSGRTLFKVSRPTDALDESTNAYTTPLLMSTDGQKQIIIYGGDYLTGHDPVTGTELWRYHYVSDKQQMDRLIPTPVVAGTYVYCVYPRGERTFAVEVSLQNPARVRKLWTYAFPGPDVPCPVLYHDSLYLIEEKKKTLTCLNPATGTERWVGVLDKADAYYASPTAADGKLYTVNRKGAVTVVAANSNQFRVLSRTRFEEGPVDSTIAIADDKVFLRTAENLYCFGKKTP